MTNPSVTIELPREVVYYNKWTGFRCGEIGKLFKSLSYDEASALNPGDTIWLDTEQPSGKVYGLDRVEVVSLMLSDSFVGISYQSPNREGSTAVPKEEKYHTTNRCLDDMELVKLVMQNPLAIETGTVGSISSASAAYLERIGARIVPAN